MNYLPFKVYTFSAIVFFSFSLFFTQITKAQHSCGTNTDQVLRLPLRLLDNNRDSLFGQDSSTYLAIKIHIVQNDTGFSIVSHEDVHKEVKEINEVFKGANLQFYLYDTIDYIQNTNFYQYEIAQDEFALRAYAELNTINVFLVESINANSNPFAAYTYLPPGPDIIFITHSSIKNDRTILAHELGHYLGLYHTHGLSNTKLTDELVNGSNCNIAGDMICDTPADPNLLGKVNDDCEYTEILTDSNGDVFNPDVKNIMSYALDKCCEYFTDEQFERMSTILDLYRSNIKRYRLPIKTEDTIKIEVEETFEIVTEQGNKSNIQVFDDFISDNGEGKAVTLFDKGDQLKVDFTIEESGDYHLKVRLRSGFLNNPVRYWQKGYSFFINNEIKSFEGDTASISPLYSSFGGAHWSIMNHFITLEEGEYTFSITSELDWGAIDYIEIAKIQGTQEEGELLFFQRIEVEDDYTIIREAGNKSKIGIFEEALGDSDTSKVLTLFDVGDKFSIPFSIEKRAAYEIGVGVRSGHHGNSTRYWPDGYRFSINDVSTLFKGDTATLSPFYKALGGTYWGIMKFEDIFGQGSYTLSIESNLDWAAVDYIYISEIPNNAPTDILLSNQGISENNEIGDFIGVLSTEDQDLEDTHTYKLVDGEIDNLNFKIIGDSLFSQQVFDYEKQSQYSIKIETVDQFGKSFEKEISISIENVYDSFVSFTLSGLNKIYNGIEQSVLVETNPQNVAFQLTYNGKLEMPVNVGSYLVNVESINPEYQGSITDTLIVKQAPAQIIVSELEQAFDGTPKPIMVSTEPANLDILVTYNNQDSIPVSVGEYNVYVSIIDKNFEGEIEADLLIYQSKDSLENTNPSSRLSNLGLGNNDTDNVESLHLMESKKIFPNPTSGRFSILTDAVDESKEIKIFDSSGRDILSFKKSTKSKELQVDLTQQPNGIYFIQLLYKERVEVFKVVKE